jgi:hypothetical protein
MLAGFFSQLLWATSSKKVSSAFSHPAWSAERRLERLYFWALLKIKVEPHKKVGMILFGVQ